MVGILFYGRPNVSETFPTITELTPAIFRCLREGVYSGIVLPDFATEEEVAAGIRAGRQLSAGSGEWPGPSVGSASNPERLDYYLSEAQATVDKTRRIFGGCTPIDRLFARFLEIHAPGVRIPSWRGRSFASQHWRGWGAGADTPPHCDCKNTFALRHLGLCSRWASNVYLVGSDDGGALELWDPYDEVEYAQLEASTKGPAGFGLDRTTLPPPKYRINPPRRSLVIFDAGILHAVAPVTEDMRMTVSSFIGMTHPNEALYIFA
jgi:hypothetical protein